MKSGSAKAIEIAQAVLAILVVPALWPLSFIGAAIFLPGTIDPLLGGLQNVLYIPGLIWLLAVLLSTVGIARLFQVKRNNVLFLGTSIALALVLSSGLCAYLAWGDYQLIGQKGVIYPDHFDVIEEAGRFLMVSAFTSAVSFVTACIFAAIGGFRLWKPNT